MNENPDAVPQAAAIDPGPVPVDIPFTPTAQQLLDETRPWVLFLAVMIFIASAFMALAGVSIILMGIGMGSFSLTRGRSVLAPAAGNIIGGFFYILMSIVYVAPGVFLLRYASAIKLLEVNRSAQVLEDALRNQRSFWRYIGIVTIISLILAILFVILGLAAAFLYMRR
jgi:hypothetical protein